MKRKIVTVKQMNESPVTCHVFGDAASWGLVKKKKEEETGDRRKGEKGEDERRKMLRGRRRKKAKGKSKPFERRNV